MKMVCLVKGGGSCQNAQKQFTINKLKIHSSLILHKTCGFISFDDGMYTVCSYDIVRPDKKDWAVLS